MWTVCEKRAYLGKAEHGGLMSLCMTNLDCFILHDSAGTYLLDTGRIAAFANEQDAQLKADELNGLIVTFEDLPDFEKFTFANSMCIKVPEHLAEYDDSNPRSRRSFVNYYDITNRYYDVTGKDTKVRKV